jgi:RNA polymerase sigma factor (sigma-70 family)
VVRVSDDLLVQIEEIYRSRYGAFLRVSVAIVRDEQLAEEAVHDGFVRALRYRVRFVGGSVEAWLWRIVVNEARRRRAVVRGRLVEEPLGEADKMASANGHRGDGAVAALVAALPERQRLVLFLRYYADLDYAAIADALEIKSGTVAATLHTAHAALRRQLLEVEG